MPRKRSLQGKPLTAVFLPLAATAVVAAAVIVPSFGGASSHREAPAIIEDPAADNTDVYFFRSPDAPDTATIIANWIPFQEPMGGPNFYLFSTKARYNLNVDQTGDGKWDVRYQYRFRTSAPKSDAAGYLYVGPDNKVLVNQNYDLVRQTRNAKGKIAQKVIGKRLPVAPNNVGPKSLPDYLGLRNGAVVTPSGIAGAKSFAGQSDDPFFVDLGVVFDLVNLDKPGRTGIGTGNQGNGVDTLARYNVNTIALQLPIAELKGAEGDVVGVYASTERPVDTVKITKATRRVKGVRVTTQRVKRVREWRQVSRLGNPLVNEVIIPRYLKDRWNSEDPSTDAKYDKYFTSPFVGAALNALFPSLNLNIPTSGRGDISAALLNGVPNLNNTGTTKADLLRLNLSTPVSATPQPMGVLQGDVQGFPNGRRLGDDVVDIELRVIGGAVFDLAGGTANKLPLGDGVNQNDVPFQAAFPYVAPAHDGFSTTPSHYRTEPASPPVGPLP